MVYKLGQFEKEIQSFIKEFYKNNYRNASRAAYNIAKKYGITPDKIFRRGKLYVFDYESDKDIDPRPIILGMGGGLGLNLHLMPMQARIKFMDTLLTVIGKYLDDETKDIDDLNPEFIKKAYGKYGITNCFRSYDPRKIKNIYQIPFKHWKEVILDDEPLGAGLKMSQMKFLEHLK